MQDNIPGINITLLDNGASAGSSRYQVAAPPAAQLPAVLKESTEYDSAHNIFHFMASNVLDFHGVVVLTWDETGASVEADSGDNPNCEFALTGVVPEATAVNYVLTISKAGYTSYTETGAFTTAEPEGAPLPAITKNFGGLDAWSFIFGANDGVTGWSGSLDLSWEGGKTEVGIDPYPDEAWGDRDLTSDVPPLTVVTYLLTVSKEGYTSFVEPGNFTTEAAP